MDQNSDSDLIFSLDIGNCVYFMVKPSIMGSGGKFLTKRKIFVQVYLKWKKKTTSIKSLVSWIETLTMTKKVKKMLSNAFSAILTTLEIKFIHFWTLYKKRHQNWMALKHSLVLLFMSTPKLNNDFFSSARIVNCRENR